MKLNEGEYICKHCNGSGIGQHIDNKERLIGFCGYCRGTGKVDWIKKAIGPASDIVSIFNRKTQKWGDNES